MARLVTRAQAADTLGVSLRTFRRLEAGGAIAPRERAHGCAWYSASDVAELRALREHNRPTTDGEVAARIYRLIAKGMRVNDIVLAARQPPDVVRDLVSAYHEADGAMVLDARHVGELRSAIGDVRTADEMTARVVSLARRRRRPESVPERS